MRTRFCSFNIALYIVSKFGKIERNAGTAFVKEIGENFVPRIRQKTTWHGFGSVCHPLQLR